MPAVRDKYAPPASAPARIAIRTPPRDRTRNTARTQQVKNTSENIRVPNRIRYGFNPMAAIIQHALLSENP